MSGDVIKLEVQGVDPVWPMYMFELDIDKPGKRQHRYLSFNVRCILTLMNRQTQMGDSTTVTGHLKIKPNPESDDMVVKQELVKLEDTVEAEENGPRNLGRYIRYIPQHPSCN
ncbi:hypothetical protein PAXRUDRAFT_164385 [Paxillus rubicundulus Ve08.2h10]|uniref:Uncharacterized protein n=1 Tax=Paxillus rubicundulus Ve08.2h10 TaxID=930991 RepID=A0A0D0DJH4_9AGAM|nr:hypothetical protein PAXRUDRAFT_164385 [Paxillus rubicundulus Ve08.2h10]